MKKEFLLLLLIILGAFVVRLYRFTNPIADWHSWRQADTSAVSRNFVKYGFDISHPHFDDLSNVPSGKDNPQGYRFVEFPIYNLAQAGFFTLIGVFTIEEWGRLVSIISTLLTILFIYLLVKKHANQLTAFLAAFFYAFLPYTIYYGRTTLPDPSMVMAIMGGIYFWDKWIEKSEKRKAKSEKLLLQELAYFILALLFTASAFLLKPYALFFTLPMIYLTFANFGLRAFKKWQIWVFAFLVVIPLILWRLWMRQYPEGVPANDWLFNAGNIRFKGAYFYWIFADRIGRLILGYWGVAIFIIGILVSGKSLLKKQYWFFLSFLLSSLLYIVVIARGNVQHDYYQILIIPSLTIFLALGSAFLINPIAEFTNKYLSRIVFVICSSFMLFFGWYFVRDYFNINHPEIIAAGKAVDQLTPKNAKVIAPYDGDTTFLYQTKRQGWASFEKTLEELITMGANYLVLVNPKPEDYSIDTKYKLIASTPSYLIYDLHQR